MVTVSVHCPRCHSDEIYRHGLSPTKRELFRCQCCHRVFQLTYRYEARKPGVKEQIIDMAFNGAGVRDTARTLKIGINTVIRALKSSRPAGQRLLPLLTPMSPLSVNLMSNGASFVATDVKLTHLPM